MILPSSTSFFAIKALDEAAEAITFQLAPGTALDIVNVTFLSRDFESDVYAIDCLDKNMKVLLEAMSEVEVAVSEKFNPIYLPGKISDLYDAVDVDSKNGSGPLNAVDGNPYTIKLIEAISGDETVLVGKAQYRTFEMPSYSEIVQAHEQFLPN